MRLFLVLFAVSLLSACHDEAPKKQDNPLLKLQQQTVKHTQKVLDQAAQREAKLLHSVGQ